MGLGPSATLAQLCVPFTVSPGERYCTYAPFCPFRLPIEMKKNVPWYLANDCVVADELQTSLR